MKFLFHTPALMHLLSSTIMTRQKVEASSCPRSLSVLESHLKGEILENDAPLFGTYECDCNIAANGDDLPITCVLAYDGPEGEVIYTVENITLTIMNKSYQKKSTAWADSLLLSYDEPQESFDFINGELTSCTAANCNSCEICPDSTSGNVSVAVNCSNPQDDAADEHLIDLITCSDNYQGAFSNNFDVSELVFRGRKTITPQEFCANLSELEVHMTNEFATLSGEIETSMPSYVCACNNNMSNSLKIDCNVHNNVENKTGSREREQVTLEPNADGTFVLVQTSWADMSHPSYDDPQETFYFQHGALSGCKATNCVSCSICSDGVHIAVDCSNLTESESYSFTCGDRYRGAYSNYFNFSGIVMPSEREDTDSGAITNGVFATARDTLVAGLVWFLMCVFG